jgi:hypothetical protein
MGRMEVMKGTLFPSLASNLPSFMVNPSASRPVAFVFDKGCHSDGYNQPVVSHLAEGETFIWA